MLDVNESESWLSNSVLSVMTTMVGFASLGWRITLAVNSSISIDLPDPCVCHTTPARPSESTARTVLSIAFFTAKYWWGLAILFSKPFSDASKAT